MCDNQVGLGEWDLQTRWQLVRNLKDGLVHNIISSVQFGKLQNEIFIFILKLVLLEWSESKSDADAGGCCGLTGQFYN